VKKFLFIFYFLVLSSYFLVIPAHASENFTTAYDTTYTVNETGITHAVFKVTLTNSSSKYFASSYKINLGLADITNIDASDPDGKILPSVSKTNYGQNVSLQFNKKVVGKGKELQFTLAFDTQSIAEKQGQIWEVNIPKIANQNNFSNFSVHVKVPPSFGTPTYIKPEHDTATLDFTKEQLGKSGISLAFGEKQQYHFSLTYHLKNAYIFPIRTEIALPPSTNYQDVAIENISPKPVNVRRDSDGNWLAQYRLLPSKKIDVIVSGNAQIALSPKKEILSETELSEYIKEKPYWETNEKIKKLALTLKTPEAIYAYVVKNLTYDFSRVTNNSKRLGASAVLDNPSSSVCLEFTDLFIALARAAGIPAREMAGFAYTQNVKQRPLSLVKDILHVWPEYYDREQQKWIMIDPTWENTTDGIDYFHTLDFDHFTFVIRGQNSDYPIPAGGYKLDNSDNTKDVHITFAKSFTETISTLDSLVTFPNFAFSYSPIQGIVELKNTGKVAYPQGSFLASSPNLLPKEQTIFFDPIPPYGSIQIPVEFAKTSLFTNKKTTVTIHIGEHAISQEIQISPIFATKFGMIGGVLLAIFAIFVSFFAKRTWRLLFFR